MKMSVAFAWKYSLHQKTKKSTYLGYINVKFVEKTHFNVVQKNVNTKKNMSVKLFQNLKNWNVTFANGKFFQSWKKKERMKIDIISALFVVHCFKISMKSWNTKELMVTQVNE